MSYKTFSCVLSFIAWFLLSQVAVAQQRDSLADMRLFMKVCNVYKQMPLQLDLEMQNSTNLVTDEEDTAHFDAKFFLQERGSYIAFGELEQVADDSLLLLVSNKLKRMILYGHRLSVADQLSRHLGVQLKDSSVLQLAARFRISQGVSGKDTAVLEMNSRSLLHSCSLPKESIRLSYDPVRLQPIRVVQTMRRLVSVDESTYAAYLADKGHDAHLAIVSDSSYFIIKEQVSAFAYRRVAHEAGGELPVRMTDRVVADVAGKYSPAMKYQDFLLTQNF